MTTYLDEAALELLDFLVGRDIVGHIIRASQGVPGVVLSVDADTINDCLEVYVQRRLDTTSPIDMHKAYGYGCRFRGFEVIYKEGDFREICCQEDDPFSLG